MPEKQEGGEPRLIAKHLEFPCGYGPRSIRLSTLNRPHSVSIVNSCK